MNALAKTFDGIAAPGTLLASAGQDAIQLLRMLRRTPVHTLLLLGVLVVTNAVAMVGGSVRTVAGTASEGAPMALLGSALALIVAFALLTGYVNAAALHLAWTLRRRNEFAVRRAVGADEGRIIRQLVTEAVIITCAAWLLAALAATLLAPVIGGGASHGSMVRQWVSVGSVWLSGAVFAATTLALSCPVIALRTGSRVVSFDRLRGTHLLAPDRLLNALVMAQIAFSVVFIATTFRIAMDVLDRPDPVPASRNLVVFELSSHGPLPGPLLDSIETRLLSTRSVEDVSIATGVARLTPIASEAIQVPETGVGTMVNAIRVSPSFHGMFGIPIEIGREFVAGDSLGAPLVAIASTALAERLWGRIDPRGQQIEFGPEHRPVRIVGLVREPLPESGRDEVLYLPAAQHPVAEALIIVRFDHQLGELRPEVERAVGSVETSRRIRNSYSLAALTERAQAPYRRLMRAGWLAGTLQGLVTLLGLYGVVSNFAESRRAEIGLRSAIGARGKDIVQFVLYRQATLVACGMAVGVAGGWFVGRVLAGGPGDIRELTPLVTAATAVLAAAAATIIVRTARTMTESPSEALRGR